MAYSCWPVRLCPGRPFSTRIEIWRLDQYAVPGGAAGTASLRDAPIFATGDQTARQIFATGYAAWANTLIDVAPEKFRDAVAFALELDADNMAALELLARLYEREDRPVEAEQVYRRLVARYPDETRFWHALARLKFAAGKHSEAVVCFAAALERQPAHPLTHNNLAVTYRELGDERVGEQPHVVRHVVDDEDFGAL